MGNWPKMSPLCDIWTWNPENQVNLSIKLPSSPLTPENLFFVFKCITWWTFVPWTLAWEYCIKTPCFKIHDYYSIKYRSFWISISFRSLCSGFQMVKWRVQKLYIHSIGLEMLLCMKSGNASHERESIALEGLSGFLILFLFPHECSQIFIEMLSLRNTMFLIPLTPTPTSSHPWIIFLKFWTKN